MTSNTVSKDYSVILHPLVILNISDHYSRMQLCSNSKSPRVMGALMGLQDNDTPVIVNSIEIVDMQMFEADRKLFTTIYPDLEVMGWYRTLNCNPNSHTSLTSLTSNYNPNSDTSLTSLTGNNNDFSILRKFDEFNESPLTLTLNPISEESELELPISICQEGRFVKFILKNNDSERITLDHIGSIGRANVEDASILDSSLYNLKEGLNSLSARLAIILDFLKQMKIKQTQNVNLITSEEHKILKDIKDLLNRLPIQGVENNNFNVNTILSAAALNSLTSCTTSLSSLIDKTAHSKVFPHSKHGKSNL